MTSSRPYSLAKYNNQLRSDFPTGVAPLKTRSNSRLASMARLLSGETLNSICARVAQAVAAEPRIQWLLVVGSKCHGKWVGTPAAIPSRARSPSSGIGPAGGRSPTRTDRSESRLSRAYLRARCCASPSAGGLGSVGRETCERGIELTNKRVGSRVVALHGVGHRRFKSLIGR